ncbi:MAG TPA: peptidase S10, partial [Phycisphaerae bacterium]|nr:peptidase S10 [Phycisphaerae bacterium]
GARGPAEGPAAQPAEKVSVTLGKLRTANGEELGYTASAGYLALKDEQGKLRANIFYTSYVVPQGPATQAASQPGTQASSRPAATEAGAGAGGGGGGRPVTFLFNGGPGAASVWLHLGAVGPERLDVPADGSPPKAPYKLVNNEYSWLPASDLVFIDPVNTGYSRAAEPGDAKQFFGVTEDVNAVGEFIRLWLTNNKRWDSPIFVAGESYGTTRAAALADHLQQRVGVEVSGVILMSTVLNFATLDPSESNDLGYELYVPSYAAVAFYHHKLGNTYANLDAVLKDAEQFTLNDYTVALAKGAALPEDQRQAVANKLSSLIGLPAGYILQSNLRVPPQRFEKELLRGSGDTPGEVIGRFDGRLTGHTTDTVNDSATYDPSLSGFYPAYTSAFNTYVRDTLKFDSELPYEVLSGRTQPWNWGGNGVSGYLYVGDNLRDAMTQNPHLRLMVCQGRFDLATPYFATDYTVNHLGLAPALRKNITQKYYPGGHMVYHVRAGLEQLSKDAQAFIRGAGE